MMDMVNGPIIAAMMGVGGLLLILLIAVLVLSSLALVKFLRRSA